MRIWHRRSLRTDLSEESNAKKHISMEEQDDEDIDNEDCPSNGRYFPNLFKTDEDILRNRSRKPLKMVNRSWPPLRRITSCPDEEEEEHSGEDENGEELEEDDRGLITNAPKKQKPEEIGWRSLPIRDAGMMGSRSTSASRKEQRQTFHESDDELPALGQNKLLKDCWSARMPFNGFIFCAGLAVLLILILCIVFPLFISYEQLTPREQFEKYRRELRQLVDEQFEASIKNNELKKRQSKVVFQTLLYIASKMLERNEQRECCSKARKNGISPLTLLVASADVDRASALMRIFSRLLQNNWPPFRLVNRQLNSSATRIQLDRSVLNVFLGENRPTMFALMLENLHLLSDKAPLFLHSLVDPESSPLLLTPHNILVIGSLQILPAVKEQNEEENRDWTCQAHIERTLLQLWKSDILNEDQIHPIIARLSAHSICLD